MGASVNTIPKGEIAVTGLEALLYYVLLMIALVIIYAGHRIPLALLGKKPIDSWTRGRSVEDPGLVVRASHAHANTVENLGLFAVVVLAAAAMDRSNVVDAVAVYILGARLAQVAVHLIGTSFVLIMMRATFFLVQLALIGYVAWQLLCPVAAT